jgi:hypothetical protein
MSWCGVFCTLVPFPDRRALAIRTAMPEINRMGKRSASGVPVNKVRLLQRAE